jgi:hypothetical protein
MSFYGAFKELNRLEAFYQVEKNRATNEKYPSIALMHESAICALRSFRLWLVTEEQKQQNKDRRKRVKRKK